MDYYGAILGTPFLRKHAIDFMNNCLRIKDKIVCNQANGIKWGRGTHRKIKRMFQ